MVIEAVGFPERDMMLLDCGCFEQTIKERNYR